MRLNKISLLILLIAVFFLVISFNLYLVSFNQSFYYKEFEKYGVYETFDKEVVNNEFNKVLNYLKNGREIKSDFFNEKEIEHLKDVRKVYFIFEILFWISLFTLILLLIYLIYICKDVLFLKGLFLGSLFLLLLIVLLLILLFINFDFIFTLMHKILFWNNLWLLNSETDNLIKILPLQIFYDLSLKLFFYILLSCILVLSPSYFVMRFYRKLS